MCRKNEFYSYIFIETKERLQPDLPVAKVHLRFLPFGLGVEPGKLKFKKFVLRDGPQLISALGNFIKGIGICIVHLRYLLVGLCKCKPEEVHYGLGMHPFDIRKEILLCRFILKRFCFLLPLQGIIPEKWLS